MIYTPFIARIVRITGICFHPMLVMLYVDNQSNEFLSNPPTHVSPSQYCIISYQYYLIVIFISLLTNFSLMKSK